MNEDKWLTLAKASEIVLEIKFGCGGEDSKCFVDELFSAYVRYADSKSLKTEILDSDHGHILAKITGIGAFKAFSNEIGQHACQRVPPNERSGRRHTSMISVAVLPIKEDIYEPLKPEEVEITSQCGKLSCGGQNANRRHTACRAIHKATGISVFMQNERSQKQNQHEALKILTARVNDLRQSKADSAYSDFRRNTLGDGRRGSKVRTYNFINSRITDHRLGKKTSRVDDVMRGKFELLL